MSKQTHKQWVEQVRALGPVAWAESAHGWLGPDGRPVVLADWQAAVLQSWWEHREHVTTLAISSIKKAGKTWLNAVLLAWRWLAMPGLHFAAGNDLDQSAGRQFSEIADMCKRHPYLSSQVKAGKLELVFLPTGSALAALAADAAGNAGANHLTASHTETWAILYEQGRRAYEELTPPPGRFYGLPALRVCDSYAGFLGESETWHNLVDRGLAGERIDDTWPLYLAGRLLLFHAEGQEAQERCYRADDDKAAYYAEQRADLRAVVYARMHENTRQAGESGFCDPDDWAALVDPEHAPLAPGSKTPLYIGLDLATGAKGDDAALVGVYPDDGKAKLALHKLWKGRERRSKLKIKSTVYPFLLNLRDNYNLAGVWYDPYQCLSLVEDLQEAGIKCVEVTQTHKSRGPRDTALQEMVKNKELVLYENDDVKSAPSGAICRELPTGGVYLKKRGRLRIDLLVALANVAVEARHKRRGRGWVGVMSRDLTGGVFIRDGKAVSMSQAKPVAPKRKMRAPAREQSGISARAIKPQKAKQTPAPDGEHWLFDLIGVK